MVCARAAGAGTACGTRAFLPLPQNGEVNLRSELSEAEIARRALAIHEAGHQVMAVALGVRSKGVELLEDSGRSFDGLNRRRYHPSEGQYWHLLQKEIQILLAGECAVQLFYEELGDGSNAYGSDEDRVEFQLLARELSGRGRDGGYPPPPAQIRTCGTTAYGSSGHGFATRP